MPAILFADDQLVNRILLGGMLKSRLNPESIHEAKNGAEAVTCFNGNPAITVVITDFDMPIKNGLAAAKEILESKRDVCVYVWSAKHIIDEGFAALENGYKDKIFWIAKGDLGAQKLQKILVTHGFIATTVVNQVASSPSAHEAKLHSATSTPLSTNALSVRVLSTPRRDSPIHGGAKAATPSAATNPTTDVPSTPKNVTGVRTAYNDNNKPKAPSASRTTSTTVKTEEETQSKCAGKCCCCSCPPSFIPSCCK